MQYPAWASAGRGWARGYASWPAQYLDEPASRQYGIYFDPSDLHPRIAALIKLLGSISLPESERVAFALHVEPLALLSIGDASTVGHRSRTTMPFASRNSCTVAPEDTLTLGSVRAYASEVAEELTERLTAALRSA